MAYIIKKIPFSDVSNLDSSEVCQTDQRRVFITDDGGGERWWAQDSDGDTYPLAGQGGTDLIFWEEDSEEVGGEEFILWRAKHDPKIDVIRTAENKAIWIGGSGELPSELIEFPGIEGWEGGDNSAVLAGDNNLALADRSVTLGGKDLRASVEDSALGQHIIAEGGLSTNGYYSTSVQVLEVDLSGFSGEVANVELDINPEQAETFFVHDITEPTSDNEEIQANVSLTLQQPTNEQLRNGTRITICLSSLRGELTSGQFSGEPSLVAFAIPGSGVDYIAYRDETGKLILLGTPSPPVPPGAYLTRTTQFTYLEDFKVWDDSAEAVVTANIWLATSEPELPAIIY